MKLDEIEWFARDWLDDPTGDPDRVGPLARAVLAMLPVVISLKAAGFTCLGMSAGGEHDRPSRRRNPAKQPQRKYRWWRRL